MSVKVTTDGLLGCQKMSQTFVSRDEALHFLENAFLMSHNSPVMYKLNRTSKMNFTNNRLTSLRIFKLSAYFERLIGRCSGCSGWSGWSR